MKEVIFTLSKFEYIKIISDYGVDFKIINMCCDNVKVYFVNQEFELRIGQEAAGEVFEFFIKRLKKAISNSLVLHESLIKNLGIMENERSCMQPREDFTFVTVPTSRGQSTYWVGSNYEIWTTFADANPYVNTWLYNNQGHIILEVTPFYKWSMQEGKSEDPDFVTYEEFMKNYKPLLRRVIPREIAVEWLEQAMKVYRGFFSSEENYINMCKQLGW